MSTTNFLALPCFWLATLCHKLKDATFFFFYQDNVECQPSSGMVYAPTSLWLFPLLLHQCHEHNDIVPYQLVNTRQDAINPVGAEPSSCNGKNDEKHAVIPTVLNSTTNSISSYSYKNTGTETMVRTTCVVFFPLPVRIFLVLFLLSDVLFCWFREREQPTVQFIMLT